MAWKYPKYDIASGFVIDVDPINDNFLPVVNEHSGSLDEHNLSATSSGVTRAKLATDAAFTLHHSHKAASPTNYTNKTSWLKISPSDDWQAYPNADGMRLEVVSTGTTMWACASLQLICGFDGTNQDAGFSNFQKGFGFNVALRLDGVVVYDSLLGSGDTSNEFYRGFNNRGGVLEPSVAKDLAIPQCGGGLAGARLPVTVDAVIDISPGEHVLEVVVMNIRGHNRSTATDRFCYIATREIFALEMAR